jgi:hypothetical protein
VKNDCGRGDESERIEGIETTAKKRATSPGKCENRERMRGSRRSLETRVRQRKGRESKGSKHRKGVERIEKSRGLTKKELLLSIKRRKEHTLRKDSITIEEAFD